MCTLIAKFSSQAHELMLQFHLGTYGTGLVSCCFPGVAGDRPGQALQPFPRRNGGLGQWRAFARRVRNNVSWGAGALHDPVRNHSGPARRPVGHPHRAERWPAATHFWQLAHDSRYRYGPGPKPEDCRG